MRSGSYSRSSLSTVGNAFVYGTYETPGQSWTGPWPGSPPAPSTRNYDGKPDLATRGHLYLKSIYDPENPTVTHAVQRWDSGGKLVTDLSAGSPSSRRLLTVNSTNASPRSPAVNTAEDLLLPATQLCRVNGGKYVFDLNQDGVCTSADRDFLKDWLYGWEDNQQPPPTGGAPRLAHGRSEPLHAGGGGPADVPRLVLHDHLATSRSRSRPGSSAASSTAARSRHATRTPT